jgi:hypothetical protein
MTPMLYGLVDQTITINEDGSRTCKVEYFKGFDVSTSRYITQAEVDVSNLQVHAKHMANVQGLTKVMLMEV